MTDWTTHEPRIEELEVEVKRHGARIAVLESLIRRFVDMKLEGLMDELEAAGSNVAHDDRPAV